MALDSTKPDLAEGEIGRERYSWIRQQLEDPEADLRAVALHHHLVPVPGTGRERNTVWDSGDVLALLADVGVQLVLCGHKHVPYVWLLNGVLVVNSGTVSSYRLRGYVRPSYNLIEVDDRQIRVTFRYPGSGERFAAPPFSFQELVVSAGLGDIVAGQPQPGFATIQLSAPRLTLRGIRETIASASDQSFVQTDERAEDRTKGIRPR